MLLPPHFNSSQGEYMNTDAELHEDSLVCLSDPSDTLTFYLNATKVSLKNPAPETTLLTYLRSIGLTGTKLGCAEGGCGACTVLVSFYDIPSKRPVHSSVNACLAPLCSVDGKHVITVEGIGSVDDPHPAQERIARMFGSQCGFCTPGIVMALYALLRNSPSPTEEEIEEAFDGNLCRCTGYRPIFDAARTFASDKKNEGCCGSKDAAKCNDSAKREKGPGGCGVKNCCQTRDFVSRENEENHAFPKVEFKKYDPSQELIFPPGLIKYTEVGQRLLAFSSNRCKWFRPVTVTQLLAIKRAHPDAKLIAGNTEVGIEVKFKRMKYSVLVYVADIPELRLWRKDDEGITIGANMTLTNVRAVLQHAVDTMDPTVTEPYAACLANIRFFAGNQIRNVATLGGNIATASPISDMNPVLVAARGHVTVISATTLQKREIPGTDLFLGYRKTAIAKEEVLVSVHIPFSRPNEFICAFKQARRRDDDIAIANCGARVLLNPDTFRVEEASLVYGGMGPTSIQAEAAQQALVGARWADPEVLEKAQRELIRVDFPLNISVPGGMAEYRCALASSFLFKFWCHVGRRCSIPELVEEGVGADVIERSISFGRQDFEQVHLREGTESMGKALPHVAAMKQVCGQAQYTDDLPKIAGELYAGLVMSTRAHAKILRVDTLRALEHPGVHGYVDSRDVGGSNVWGPTPLKDEEIFATTTVHFYGQIIGCILAVDQITAQEAARMVTIEYEELPVILTIEDAIEKESFLHYKRQISIGDLDKGFTHSDYVIEGETRVGGQEHFYLETQASMVIPSPEDGGLEILVSTQNPTETQHVIAHVLGVPSNLVSCRVKRLGGGFGGKETRSIPISAVCAVAARKFRKPVRIMLDRDEDMALSGQRHPFLGKWKVGFTKAGKIVALDLKLFSNAGWSSDLSLAVLERAMTHADNCYKIPNMRVSGKVCITNTVSNTAFRGFGGPQGMFITESCLSEVADRLGIPVEVVRERNLYKEGDHVHFNQKLTDWHIPAIMAQITKEVDLPARKAAIEKFNAENRWRKRGYSLIPTKFGISFTHLTLNQAGALVHIYADGSVLLAHGGTEMGQGLHTKMIQVAAEALRVPVETVHVAETSTTTVPNTSATAASASSDLNGMAVLDACKQLNERLQPYRMKMPEASMPDLALQAYLDRVNLSANGFYKTPDIGFDWDTMVGKPFFYYTQGGAYSEVEIDVLTGDHTILRTDIVMDVGRSLNMGIDVGQVEGAFIQGVGWTTLEETLVFPSGRIQTIGPGAYKIPGFRDVPQEFNVGLLKGAQYPHLKTIGSSKGVGEPPLFLGSTVFFAIRDAVKAARNDARIGKVEEGLLRMSSPATAERIRLACRDDIVRHSAVKVGAGEKGWVVVI